MTWGLAGVASGDVLEVLGWAFVAIAGGYPMGYWLRAVESIHRFGF